MDLIARVTRPISVQQQEREELENALQVARRNSDRFASERDIIAAERNELLIENARLNEQINALLAAQ